MTGTLYFWLIWQSASVHHELPVVVVVIDVVISFALNLVKRLITVVNRYTPKGSQMNSRPLDVDLFCVCFFFFVH